MKDWFSVKESLPKRGIPVLVRLIDNSEKKAILFHNDWHFIEGNFNTMNDHYELSEKIVEWSEI